MGYVHSQLALYIPPTLFHFSTGTITWTAGAVAGMIAAHRAAANQTTLITVPIMVPGHAQNTMGSKVLSVEFDYKVEVAEPTTFTPTILLVSRGVEGAAGTVATQTITQTPTLAASQTVDEHKLVVTITTPFFLLNTQYLLALLTMPAGAGGNTTDFYGAMVNYIFRA